MPSAKRELGDLGEEIGTRFLKNKGFLIIGRNYLRPYGEIDIIASRAGIIHFFEVKTVSREIAEGVIREKGDDWNPAELIHPKKLQRMQKAINSYLSEHKLDLEWQIDGLIVEIDERRKLSKVEWIEGIGV